MKALTSSCSKAINERLVSPSHTGTLNVPDRHEFCFSLFSRNDKKGCNSWFLKLVQNKGITIVHPVHAHSARSQVDLETEEHDLEAPKLDLETEEPALRTTEPHGQQSEQTNESKLVRVRFQLQKSCNFGEQFLIVGDDPKLGLWDPLEALPMTWSDGHIWSIDLDLPAGKSIQFKFILKEIGADIIWQPGSDRIIKTWETMNRIIVCEDWENAELQRVIEEDQLVLFNEEPKFDLEVSNFAENLDDPKEEVSNVHQISDIEDIQTHAKEKPIAESDLQQITDDSVSSSIEIPMLIVAENIGFWEDKRDIIHQTVESTNSPKHDDRIHELGQNGNAAPFENVRERTFESNLFDSEEGPVLVPGLTPHVVLPKETGPSEVQEKTTKDTSIDEAFESKDQIQNIPESSKEEESNDGTPQEIDATIIDEPELHDHEYEEQSHLSTGKEDWSNSHPIDGNVLQNDIQWGRETVKKFLTKLGLL